MNDKELTEALEMEAAGVDPHFGCKLAVASLQKQTAAMQITIDKQRDQIQELHNVAMKLHGQGHERFLDELKERNIVEVAKAEATADATAEARIRAREMAGRHDSQIPADMVPTAIPEGDPDF